MLLIGYPKNHHFFTRGLVCYNFTSVERSTTIILMVLICVFLIIYLSKVLLLHFAGILLAVLLDGLASFLRDKTPLNRKPALGVIIVLLLLLFAAVVRFAQPRIADQITTMTKVIPEAIQEAKSRLLAERWSHIILPEDFEVKDILTKDVDFLGGVTNFFSATFGLITNLIIILFVGIYGAINPGLYSENFIRIFPAARRKRAHQVFAALARVLRWWLIGRFSSMAVVGILTAVGLILIDVPLAFTLGLIAALFSFVPYIGPVASAIPAILVAFAKSPEQPVIILYVILVYLVVQMFESYLITPMIQKRAVSIPPALLITITDINGSFGGYGWDFNGNPISIGNYCRYPNVICGRYIRRQRDTARRAQT